MKRTQAILRLEALRMWIRRGMERVSWMESRTNKERLEVADEKYRCYEQLEAD